MAGNCKGAVDLEGRRERVAHRRNHPQFAKGRSVRVLLYRLKKRGMNFSRGEGYLKKKSPSLPPFPQRSHRNASKDIGEQSSRRAEGWGPLPSTRSWPVRCVWGCAIENHGDEVINARSQGFDSNTSKGKETTDAARVRDKGNVKKSILGRQIKELTLPR